MVSYETHDTPFHNYFNYRKHRHYSMLVESPPMRIPDSFPLQSIDTGSPCIDTATVLPVEVLPDNDVVMQYVKHQGEEQRPDDSSLDIGAFERE